MICDKCGQPKRTRTYSGIKDGPGYEVRICFDCKYEGNRQHRQREGLRTFTKQEYADHNGWNHA